MLNSRFPLVQPLNEEIWIGSIFRWQVVVWDGGNAALDFHVIPNFSRDGQIIKCLTTDNRIEGKQNFWVLAPTLIKVGRYTFLYRWTDQPTDRPTDQSTDKTYRAALGR